jgi:hypothetical protein
VYTVTDTSLQPVPPSFQPQQPLTSAGIPITIPGQTTFDAGQPIVTPQQPLQIQLPPTTAFRQVAVQQQLPQQQVIVQVVTTPVPVSNTGAASTNMGIDLSNLGNLNVQAVPMQTVLTPAPSQLFTTEAYTVPGGVSFQPQPPITTAGAMITRVGAAQVLPGQPIITARDALTIPQQPLAVQVPRQATRQVPACQTITEPCVRPVCITYSCDCQSVGSCGQQTCGQQTDTRARVCTCRNNLGQTVDNSLCSSCAASSSGVSGGFAPCPTLPCCPVYTCQLGTLSACSTTCGQGTMTRPATCMQSCPGQAGSFPVASSLCVGQACTLSTQPCTICPPNQAEASIQPQQPVTVQGQFVTVIPQVTVAGNTIPRPVPVPVPGPAMPGQTVTVNQLQPVNVPTPVYVPITQAPTMGFVPVTYGCVQSGTTACTAPQNCGSGTQTVTFRCLSSTGQEAPPQLCPGSCPAQQTTCQLAACAVATAQPQFVLSTVNTNSCPFGSTRITDEATCRAAAVSRGQEFKIDTQAQYPAGCQVYAPQNQAATVFLNLHPTGANDRFTTPICRTGMRRSQHSTPEQPQGPSTLLVALGAIVAIVAIVASAVVVFNRVVNKLVEAELRAMQA